MGCRGAGGDGRDQRPFRRTLPAKPMARLSGPGFRWVVPAPRTMRSSCMRAPRRVPAVVTAARERVGSSGVGGGVAVWLEERLLGGMGFFLLRSEWRARGLEGRCLKGAGVVRGGAPKAKVDRDL